MHRNGPTITIRPSDLDISDRTNHHTRHQPNRTTPKPQRRKTPTRPKSNANLPNDSSQSCRIWQPTQRTGNESINQRIKIRQSRPQFGRDATDQKSVFVTATTEIGSGIYESCCGCCCHAGSGAGAGAGGWYGSVIVGGHEAADVAAEPRPGAGAGTGQYGSEPTAADAATTATTAATTHTIWFSTSVSSTITESTTKPKSEPESSTEPATKPTQPSSSMVRQSHLEPQLHHKT